MRVKITVIKCDRCKNTIRDDAPIFKVRVYEGQKSRTKEICGSCEEQLNMFLNGANLSKPGRPGKDNGKLLEAQLVAARRTANEGLERYADGATVDQLRGVLMDVVSAANRTTVSSDG